ncbi:MAG TPA: hypothetical protein PK781_03815 [Terrimesophilobacter sp.]|nr:hypothetical protein [Terrimesophilobacter sp.]
MSDTVCAMIRYTGHAAEWRSAEASVRFRHANHHKPSANGPAMSVNASDCAKPLEPKSASTAGVVIARSISPARPMPAMSTITPSSRNVMIRRTVLTPPGAADAAISP